MSSTPRLYDETGEIMLSLYGAQFALGWRGDDAFRTRMENLVFNHRLATGKGYTFKNNLIVPKYNKVNDGLTYVLTSVEKLLAGLTQYFINETIREKDYPEEARIRIEDEDGEFVRFDWRDDILFDIGYDKAEQFYNDKIQKVNFMYGIENIDATIFSLSGGDKTDAEE